MDPSKLCLEDGSLLTSHIVLSTHAVPFMPNLKDKHMM